MAVLDMRLGNRMKGAASQRQLADNISKDPVQRAFLEQLRELRNQSNSSMPRLNVQQLLLGYSRFPWLRAVVSKLSDIAAAVEWSVASPGGEPSTNHPAARALNEGNSVFSGYALRKMMFMHLSIAGEAFFMKERDMLGTPFRLWPLSPAWVIKLPLENNGFFEINIEGYVRNVAPSEIIHLRDPDPAMPYGRGTGQGTVLADELETDEFASKHLKTFFRNSARPDLLIYSEDTENPITPEDAQRLETSWLNKLRGVFNAYKPFFLPGKVGVKEIQATLKDMEMVDVRKFQRDIVMQIFGIPPEALGIIEDSNRATIESAEFFLSKHVVLPRLQFVRSAMENSYLRPDFNERYSYNYTSPVEEDKVHQLRVMRTATWAFTVDELREAAEKEPIGGEEGQYRFMPNNGGFFKSFSEVPVQQNQPSSDSDEGDEQPAEQG